MNLKDYKKPIYRKHPGISITIIALFLIILIDLIAGLLFIRPGNEQPRTYHFYYHHGFYPNVSEKTSWAGHTHHLYTNSLGMKDARVWEVPQKTDKKRIVLLGDSFTEGLGLPYEETFAGILAKKLKHYQTELLNAGITSYTPYLYYLRTKYLIQEEELQFDELLVLIDMSDLQDEIEFAEYSHWKPTEFNFFRRFFFDLSKGLKRYSFLFYKINEILRFVNFDDEERANLEKRPWKHKSMERPVVTLEKEIWEKWGKRGMQLAKNNMHKLYLLCQDNKIKLTIGVYPWPFQIKVRSLNDLQVLHWRDFCQKRNIRFINLFPVFINDQVSTGYILNNCYLDDDLHWNYSGHQIVAHALLPYFMNPE